MLKLTRVKRVNVDGQHDFVDGDVAAGQVRAGVSGRLGNEYRHLGEIWLWHRLPCLFFFHVNVLERKNLV